MPTLYWKRIGKNCKKIKMAKIKKEFKQKNVKEINK